MKIPSVPCCPPDPPRAPRTAPIAEPLEQLAGSVEAFPQRPSLATQSSPALRSRTADDQRKLALQVARQSSTTEVLRNSDRAVAFVGRFNRELHLPAEVMTRRREITVSTPAKFFRVNPALFYDDVMGIYFTMSNLLDRKAPEIIIAGDCHLGNLGTLRAADGSTFWGINDFDMAGKGSPEDDLERMATSLILMSQGGPLLDTERVELVRELALAYLKELANLAEAGPSKLAGISQTEARGDVLALIGKRSQETQHDLLHRFAEPGGQRLQRNRELHDITPQERALLDGFLAHYEQTQGDTPELKRPLQVLDVARKMESGGSTYGLNRYYLLVEGSPEPARILELKEELPTAPEQSTGNLEEANADYIFACMAALGGTYDPTMAAGTLDGDAYYLRERQREKASLDPADFTTRQQWQDLVQQAATALARAHAHQSGVARAICQWVGSDKDMLVDRLQRFAQVYAEQTVQDCAAYALSTKLS